MADRFISLAYPLTKLNLSSVTVGTSTAASDPIELRWDTALSQLQVVLALENILRVMIEKGVNHAGTNLPSS